MERKIFCETKENFVCRLKPIKPKSKRKRQARKWIEITLFRFVFVWLAVGTASFIRFDLLFSFVFFCPFIVPGDNFAWVSFSKASIRLAFNEFRNICCSCLFLASLRNESPRSLWLIWRRRQALEWRVIELMLTVVAPFVFFCLLPMRLTFHNEAAKMHF